LSVRRRRDLATAAIFAEDLAVAVKERLGSDEEGRGPGGMKGVAL